MKKLLLTMLALVCVSIGAWAYNISGGGEVTVQNGVATFHNVKAGDISSDWENIKNNVATRIKFDNTCVINKADLERFLQGNTRSCPYYQSGDEYSVVRHQAF